MAYVPPHKRHSKGSSPCPKPTPVPSSIVPQFNRSLTLGSRRRQDRHSPSDQIGGGGSKIIYAANSVSRWFAVGSSDEDPIPSSVQLQPFNCELLERRNGAKPLVLVGGEGGEVDESPWVEIAERVVPHLIDCYRNAADGGLESDRETVKFSFVARIGKVLFHGDSVNLESIRKAVDTESAFGQQVRKLFYTNVPTAYMEEIEHLVVHTLGYDFDSEKEHYHVKVFDKSRPESTISCKCTIVNDAGMLKMHKIELNPVRHLLVDISCLYKALDLRLMLLTKRTINSLDDEENERISTIINTAVIDPDVKGGLRWPLGKAFAGDRFSIVGVWHTKYKAFKSRTTRIKLRHADRFDHRTSTGEVSTEVTLRLTGISTHLRDGEVELGHIKDMVQETAELIWVHFLKCNYAST